VGFHLTVIVDRLVLSEHPTDHEPVFPSVEYSNRGSDKRFVAPTSVVPKLEMGIALCPHFSGRYGKGHLLQC
jgi:hypothetical protein